MIDIFTEIKISENVEQVLILDHIWYNDSLVSIVSSFRAWIMQTLCAFTSFVTFKLIDTYNASNALLFALIWVKVGNSPEIIESFPQFLGEREREREERKREEREREKKEREERERRKREKREREREERDRERRMSSRNVILFI